MKLFTLGYQNLNVELYVKSLVNAGVGIVLDVREHAWSQRPAFIKSNLRSSLLSAGIEYQHVKDAGNPSRNRKTARNATECLSRYRRHLKDHAGCLAELLTIIRNGSEAGRPACLTCYERESQNCHRSVLTRRTPETRASHHAAALRADDSYFNRAKGATSLPYGQRLLSAGMVAIYVKRVGALECVVGTEYESIKPKLY